MSTGLSQKERSAAMIERLNKATIESLVEVGYSKSTTQKIATTANVSTGAIFRHFGTLQDLLVDTADKLSVWMVDDYHDKIASVNKDQFDLELSLEKLREVMYSPMHYAWLELLLASRTDATLRERLIPIIKHNRNYTAERAKSHLPEVLAENPDYELILENIILLVRGQMIDDFTRSEKKLKERNDFQLRFSAIFLESWLKISSE